MPTQPHSIEWDPSHSIGWAPTMKAPLADQKPAPRPVNLNQLAAIEIASDRARLIKALKDIINVAADHSHHTHDRLAAAAAHAQIALAEIGVAPPTMPSRLY